VIKLLAAALALALPASAQQTIKNPDTLTYLGIADPDSLDPAWSYDTTSHVIILNVYEPLFSFSGSSLEKLDPIVAAKVPSRANGLITGGGKVYRIPVRKGIKFHDGTPLTPEDVKYSIQRFMLYDRDAGPSSLLLQPILGLDSTRDAKGRLVADAFALAAKAVQVKGDEVILTLPRPYAPILTILAEWAPIVSKQWAIKNGEWDGTEATWAKFNNPQKTSSAFYEKANGSGPFKLARWDRATHQIVLERNEGYWRAPARLKRVIIRAVPEFATRKLLLQAGDADTIYASAPEYTQLKSMPGVKIIDDLSIVEMNPMVYFTFKINAAGNPYIGSGKLDGEGIPADLFSDIDVRRGFAYAMDYQGYIKDVKRGKGIQATGCIPVTLPGHNPKQKTYTLDLAKSAEHFKKALGGKLWDKGFRFTILYNEGNVERENIAQILKRDVESLNPKFRIDVRPVQWAQFLDAYKSSKLPIFMLGWQADFPDPHNMAFPNMHSRGDYPVSQHYANAKADRLIEDAIAETELDKRKQLYFKLQELEYEDVPHLVIDDAYRYRTQRDWVQGWVHNPIFPDAPYGSYFYPMWKGAAAKTPARGAR
jgi:peptide/nickel transport system substrate-binding protein